MSLIAVFIASLLGSIHCAGMCGGFVALCGGQREGSRMAVWFYNLGRLLIYGFLGALSGATGQLVNDRSAATGLQDLTALAMGTLMTVWAIQKILGLESTQLDQAKLKIWRLFGVPLRKLLQSQRSLGPDMRSFLLGLLTAFLPCGWLYTFLALAAATGNPLSGALLMAVFWSGTLPMLMGLNQLVLFAGDRVAKILPRLSYAIALAAGLGTISLHFPSSASHCHQMHRSESGVISAR